MFYNAENQTIFLLPESGTSAICVSDETILKSIIVDYLSYSKQSHLESRRARLLSFLQSIPSSLQAVECRSHPHCLPQAPPLLTHSSEDSVPKSHLGGWAGFYIEDVMLNPEGLYPS